MPSTSLLIILDGFGYSESVKDNAIHSANTPVWDRLWREAPHTLIDGSGGHVGLPDGQMGNSEVGHMNLGAGRIVYQDLSRINLDIEQGTFGNNPAFQGAFEKVRSSGKALHIMGLLSPGGVHSHEDQIHALIRACAEAGLHNVYLHAFLDGRDTPPRSAEPSLASTDALLRELNLGRIASITGRYYAMDRDNRWDRVEQAYNLLTAADCTRRADTAVQGLALAYEADENDEFVQATSIAGPGEQAVAIDDGDAVIFMNFRADRAREITRAFVSDDFDGFERKQRPALADFVMLTQYADDIDTSCAYAPTVPDNTFGEYLASLGKTQLRIAETEKYAHVTFFFSGGREAPFEGEERILVPSPNVATYDLQPEMSAREVTDKLVEAIESGRFDVVVCNYANGDMVGHTGVFDAAVQAVETLDACIARLEAAVLATGGQMLITADHGNVEQMRDDHTGQAHTAHTCEPVPLVYVGPESASVKLDHGGVLADVVPTLLTLMNLPIPPQMTGRSLALAADQASNRESA
ncbi:MAG: 2,3-bisphosphoglycerate-independent phosphoglycerate mutase [Pseudomonadaceae bacterium]|nr:2,3-bisphosphoglycerate-independent phosphoglycerate mutase [Pseudomonadaceae bacterium]